ncbi:nucleotide-diphospho-sugar transferase [Stachybotrys elegans]|uniref:Nucleotide-diphospho-sugar transferase n=1 Tax=Stachybotrys elegans TaxID=80388 RepID=A0A8K0SQ20_9HYPO|nr:nucleotide-diphospho-sugar transferase [Stachybotrys elegans]
MLIRNCVWPRRTIFILGLVGSSFVITLVTLHNQYRPNDSLSSLLRLSSESDTSPSEPDIPSIPAACSTSVFNTPFENADNLAVALSPSELLCRAVDPKTPGIPKLLHQSWKDNDLPAKFKRWSRGCREKHVGWEWVLWTDDDNLKLVQTYFPWLEDIYLELPGPIYRADFVRNLYMYMFGGVYADLDVDCLRPTDEALDQFHIPFVNKTDQTISDIPENHRSIALFGRLENDETFRHSLPNAWMAASPRHPFFLYPIHFAKAKVEQRRNIFYRLGDVPTAEHITGPIALKENILRWKASLKDLWDEVILLPSHIVYPYNWHLPGPNGRICSAMFATLDEGLCKERLKVKEKGSLAITYWSNTHKGTGHNEETLAQVSHE